MKDVSVPASIRHRNDTESQTDDPRQGSGARSRRISRIHTPRGSWRRKAACLRRVSSRTCMSWRDNARSRASSQFRLTGAGLERIAAQYVLGDQGRGDSRRHVSSARHAARFAAILLASFRPLARREISQGEQLDSSGNRSEQVPSGVLAVVAAMLIAGAFKWPYGYYTLLRLVVCGSTPRHCASSLVSSMACST